MDAGEANRMKAAALGRLPACAHWGGPDVVLASDHDAIVATLTRERDEANKRADVYVAIALDRVTDLCKVEAQVKALRGALTSARVEFRYLQEQRTSYTSPDRERWRSLGDDCEAALAAGGEK